ncbi:MAG TPA: hypothetical protein VIM51_04955 [Desulfosporosinus sp.]
MATTRAKASERVVATLCAGETRGRGPVSRVAGKAVCHARGDGSCLHTDKSLNQRLIPITVPTRMAMGILFGHHL